MSFVQSPRQNVWEDHAAFEAWEAWVRVARHRAHEARPDRDSGVRRHHRPFARKTGCPRREWATTPKWRKNGLPTAQQERRAGRVIAW